MKMKPRRTPLEQEAAHQHDTTQKIKTAAGNPMHRRTTVTVERETISVVLRRPIAKSSPTPPPHASDSATCLEPRGQKPASRIAKEARGSEPNHPEKPNKE
jgi:hypothetical protein